MGIVVGMNSPLHPMEKEVVRREALGGRLPVGAKVLPEKGLGGNAFHLAAYSLSRLRVAVGYAVVPPPPRRLALRADKKMELAWVGPCECRTRRYWAKTRVASRVGR